MRVLVTGAGGQLGQDLVAALSGEVPPGGRRRALLGPEGPARPAAVDVVGADHRALPVEDRTAVLAAVDALRPDVVVHAAAWTAVDACEGDPDRAFAVNALGTRHVAEAAARAGPAVRCRLRSLSARRGQGRQASVAVAATRAAGGTFADRPRLDRAGSGRAPSHSL